MPKSPVRRAEHRRTAARLLELEEELRPLLAEVAAARSALLTHTGDDVTVDERRAMHRRLREAYLAADAVLRAATAEAKSRSRHQWMHVRSRLSALDTARQQHLMAERDELPALPVGSVRAVDTGMLAPAYGSHLHGRSSEPGTPAGYGLDVEAALRMREGAPSLAAEAEGSTGSTTGETGSTNREAAPTSPARELATTSTA